MNQEQTLPGNIFNAEEIIDSLAEAMSGDSQPGPALESKNAVFSRTKENLLKQYTELQKQFQLGMNTYANDPAQSDVASHLESIVKQARSLDPKAETQKADWKALMTDELLNSLVPPAEAALEAGKHEEAMHQACVIITLYPHSLQGYVIYLFAIENQQGAAEACRQYEAITQLCPNPILLFYAAECELRNNAKAKTKALAYLSQATQALSSEDSENNEEARNLQKAIDSFQKELRSI